MKKSLNTKILFLTVATILLFALCSCCCLSDSDYDDTVNPGGLQDGSQQYEDPSASDPITVTTTANDTDEYGLAGSYTMLKSKEYAIGEAVELTATVNEGYNFEGWYIVEKTGSGYYQQTNLVLLSKNTNYTYTMQDKSVTIAAIFSSYTITTASSTNTGGAAGSFTRLNNKKVSDGEMVELTATVNDGYNFEGWYIDGVCVSRNLTYNYTMEKENANIEVRYSCYQLSTVGYAKDASGNTEAGFNAGTYTQYSSENISVGKTVTLIATVNDGYNFAGWYIDGTCVGTELEYTYTMGKENVTIVAEYSYYTLTTTAKWSLESGPYEASIWELDSPSIYVSPIYSNQKFSVGTSITIKANEVGNYTFYGWFTGSFTLLSQNKEYTFTMPEDDVNIYAVYLEK